MSLRNVFIALLALTVSHTVLANDPKADVMAAVADLQHQWDVIQYQKPKAEQEAALKALAEKAREMRQKFPGHAEPLIWEGIILSTYAGAKGGLGALSLVKEARARLDEAEKIDGQTLGGSAYTSLGSLYYQVPGWPVGFGNSNKARSYLEKALQINPTGLDANYFYGEFFIEEGDYEKAMEALNKALQAPARPGREIADAGRRQEAQALLEKAKSNR